MTLRFVLIYSAVCLFVMPPCLVLWFKYLSWVVGVLQ